MKRALLAAAICCTALLNVGAQEPALVASGTQFMLRGKPIQIISGEMHYARIPRAYWRDRLKKARAMGLNTVSTYVFWNLHETMPGKFDFRGEKDIAEYLRIAKEEGLNVILRPGPYVCAEWDLGGYPAWLLADSAMNLRSTQPQFAAAAARWLDRLGKELKPLLASNGGPIIAVQVENEYGSFDKDKAYMQWQLDALRHAGFGSVRLYTADGDVQLPAGTLPGIPAVVNFGTGEADSSFARLARFEPGQPLMSGEYWAGWFDQWGGRHAHSDSAKQARELDWMLSRGYSVNLYMFHGGTTFGFMNGANIDGGKYHPQTTSYDYDSALDESGRPTPKYFVFGDIIAKYTHAAAPAMPTIAPAISVASFAMHEAGSLWDRVGKPVHSEHVRSMEMFGQWYGYIDYRTTLHGPMKGALAVKDVRDYAQVYLNGTLTATLDRRLGQDSVLIEVPTGDVRMDILVENGGRVNFQKVLRTERKGITKSVTFAGKQLLGWDVFTMPMSDMPKATSNSASATGPGFYAGTFQLNTVGDAYLDMRGWGKGVVWVNGHALGRFWDIGPQLSNYVPAVWLKKGKNEVMVFDMMKPAQLALAGVEKPIWK